MRRVLILACLTLGVATMVRAEDARTRAGSQTPAFPAAVEQVTVDVVVADEQSMPIKGLRRQDFTVSEDGTPQTIASFEPIEVAERPQTTTVLGQRVSSNTDAVKRTARTFVIVFDGLHLTPAGAEPARKAIEKFLVTELRDDDYVILLGTQSSTWVSTRFGLGRDDLLAALARQKGTAASDVSWDYMSEYEALRVDAFRDVDVGARVARRWRTTGYMLNESMEETLHQAQNTSSNPGAIQPGTIDTIVTDRAREVRQDSRVRQDATLALLRRILGSLTEVKGRKSVLLVSDGFVVDLEAKETRPVNEAARRANAAIYFIDTRGLSGLPAYSTASWSMSLNPNDTAAYAIEADLLSEGTQAVAADSGGFTVRNGNDLAGAMGRIARESQSYYLLGYRPTRSAPDGKFHRIGVSVSRKGVVVRARRGYFAATPGSEQPAPTVENESFQAALDSPYDLDSVPLRISTYAFDQAWPGKIKMAVVADVDVGQFRWQTKEDHLLNAVEFLLLVANRATDEVQRYDQTIEMNLRAETRAQLATWSLPIVREFELAPGRYVVKLVVREKNSGRMGTVAHEFTVPEPGTLRLSTPIVTDAFQKAPGQATPQPVMRAQRTFAAGSHLGCQYEVYGAKAGESDGKPRVSGGYAILRADGTVVSETPATAINAPAGPIVRMVVFSLAGFEPGEYRVVLKVRDEVAGQDVEVTEPFVVTAARAASGDSAQTPGRSKGTD
jgi:VWFA-related protein